MLTASKLLYIVDSDDAVRNALRLLMTDRGWDVRTFTSADDCVPAVLRQTPDCILSDLSAPALNAMAIRRALKGFGLTVPMVALTDYVGHPLANTARAEGVYEVLEKPCDARKLEAALECAVMN